VFYATVVTGRSWRYRHGSVRGVASLAQHAVDPHDQGSPARAGGGFVPLGPEDSAILALESPTVVGHTCKIVRLGPGAPGVEELRARIAERIELAPALTRRLEGDPGSYGWAPDPEFDVARHVLPAPVRGGSGIGRDHDNGGTGGDGRDRGSGGVAPLDQAPLDQAGLRELVAELFERHLERDRPLWRMDVSELDDGGTAIVWRIHHALADGVTSMRYASTLLWDDSPELRATPHERARTHERDERRRAGHLAGFLGREFRPRHSPFDGAIGTRREVAFSAVSLGELRRASRAIARATINDAVLSVLAGSLSEWVHEHHGHLHNLRVRVPVSLHHEGEDAANHDSYFSVGLPLYESDPVARLRIVHRRTTDRKSAHDAEHMDVLMHELSDVSPRLQLFCARVQSSPREFALCVSNVPGPRESVHVLGAPARTIHSLAEIGQRHALRVSVISLAGSLCFGFCADPGLVDGVQAMADGVVAQTRELVDSVQAV
jgi:WS/DGAT C-terminal domain/Wax ester synthase/diacylglycerol acyltransferase catalytic domain